MNKIILFLTLAIGAPPIANSVYTGVTTGSWHTAGNWTPAIVPNTTSAIVDLSNNLGAGAKSVAMSTTPATVNQVNFLSTPSTWSISGSGLGVLTFDGVSPRIRNINSFSGTISAPIKINSDLTIAGTGNVILSGAANFNGLNITNTNTAEVNHTVAATNATGTLYHNGKVLNHGIGTAWPNIIWSNLISGTSINWTGGGALASTVTFNDIGTNDFHVAAISPSSGSSYFGGNFSGTVTHDLIAHKDTTFANTWTGFTFGGGSKLVVLGPTNVTDIQSSTFPSTATVSINNGTDTNVTFKYTGGASFANPVIIRPSTTAIGTNYISTTVAGTNYSGGMILNSDSNCITGSLVDFFSGSLAATISGIISNGASGAANVTFRPSSSAGGYVTLSNANTYTSPTLIQGTGSVVNVTGSIGSSSLVTVSSPATLRGSGTVGAVTTSGATPNISARSHLSPSSAQVLTINGNLTEAAGTTHEFMLGNTNAASSLQVNGNITLGGTVSNYSTLYSGVFPIINYTGTRTGTLSTAIANGSISYDDGLKKVYLSIAPIFTMIGTVANAPWSTASYWSPLGGPPNGNTHTVIFSGTVTGNNGNVQLDTDATINSFIQRTGTVSSLYTVTAKKLTFSGTSPSFITDTAAPNFQSSVGIVLGADLTISGAFNSGLGGPSVLAGVISSPSGYGLNIAKTGTNPISLTATNTYTGATNISGSSIVNIAGSIAASSGVSISGTASLRGNGTVPSVTTTGGTPNITGASISPTVSQVLTIAGNLTENVSTSHNFQTDGAGASSSLQINGNLTANGTVTVTTATSGISYPIAHYTGTSSGLWTSSQGMITDNIGTKTIYLDVP
jgi:fibronectin-binding autotransporter adhesin